MSSPASSRFPLFSVGAPASALALVSGLAFFSSLAACGSGAQCALDNDCALGLRCNAEHQCVSRGTGDVDAASEERDTGPARDAGPDAPVATDAPMSMDAPIALDAPRDDANDDADLDAFDDCPVLAPSYNIDRSGLICMSMASTVMFERLPGLCGYEVSSDRRDDVQGVMTYDRAMAVFSGGLNFPDLGRSCTLDLTASPAVVIVCGSCTVELSPTP